MTSKTSSRVKAGISIRAPRSSLKPTDVPGVFRNKAGILVNEYGVDVAFKDVKKADDARFKEVLGREPRLPIDIMCGVAMDPRNPMAVRMDAAKHAAPYTSPKLVSHSGAIGVVNTDAERLAKMSNEELRLYRTALESAAAVLRGDK